jgi:hypothetical protein
VGIEIDPELHKELACLSDEDWAVFSSEVRSPESRAKTAKAEAADALRNAASGATGWESTKGNAATAVRQYLGKR